MGEQTAIKWTVRYLYAELDLDQPRPELTPEEMRAGPVMVRADARRIPLPSASVDVVVTSPPYLKQRVYGTEAAHELGREETVAEYVTMIADVFDELRRVMKPDRSHAWLNLGDKANNSGGAGGDWAKANREAALAGGGPGRFRDGAFPEASYLDVPGHVLHELMRRGWRLRLPIVWDKGRESPESLRHVRRPRWSHEMIYLLTPWERSRKATDSRPKWYPSGLVETGSVWHFPPGGDGDPHLAPFPDELARRCILPTTLPGDVVFDPFGGSGTVPRVAAELGRHGIATDIYAGRPELVYGVKTQPRNARKITDQEETA